MLEDIRYQFNAGLFIVYSKKFTKAIKPVDFTSIKINGEKAIKYGNKALELENKLNYPIVISIDSSLSAIKEIYSHYNEGFDAFQDYLESMSKHGLREKPTIQEINSIMGEFLK